MKQGGSSDARHGNPSTPAASVACRCRGVAIITTIVALALPAWAEVTVRVDGKDGGRRFEGIGAVSAGASTRLLYDYAEPYRSDVLDFLFKPNFGAGFQHLKVEIGGGENAGCGSEPSHAITREELAHPKARGYEFWLMAEARKRNPKVILDGLPWSYPGWLAGRFTQDSADWLVAFLDVARKQYELEVDWLAAAQNENGTDRDWIVKILRPTLNAKGYRDVKLQAPDDDSEFWQIFDALESDAAYRDVVQAVGYHYVNGREPWQIDQASGREATDKAKRSGKAALGQRRLEQFRPDLGRHRRALCGAPDQQVLHPRPDHEDRTLVPGGFHLRGAALGRHRRHAGRPPLVRALRGLAHGLGDRAHDAVRRPRLAVPRRRLRATRSQDLERHLRHAEGPCHRRLEHDHLHRRRDRAGRECRRRAEAGPGARLEVGRLDAVRTTAGHRSNRGSFKITLSGNSVYSLTTTTGQRKGTHEIPPDKPFPLPYQQDFERIPREARPSTSQTRRVRSRSGTSPATASA